MAEDFTGLYDQVSKGIVTWLDLKATVARMPTDKFTIPQTHRCRMTLKEYEAKFDNEHKVHANGSTYIELPPPYEQGRTELWHLDDYAVSSASFSTVWLVPRSMSFNHFMRKMLQAFPDAVAEHDNEGQLVIYTGLKVTESDQVIEM